MSKTPLSTALPAAPAPTNSALVVLSHFQAAVLLQARARGEQQVTSSLDLGISPQELSLDDSGVRLPGGESITWEQIQQIDDNDSVCFRCVRGSIEAIRGFSIESQRTFQLFPTHKAPALLISGFTMHRIAGTTPAEGAAEMVRALAPIRGRVLDTATGLGYAAIEAAKNAAEVVTVELDPVAQQIAKANPWSQRLFSNPKIKQVMGDSFAVIETLPAESFACVLHDPPAINLAGELYSEAFYRQAARVLARTGRMFHYLGDLHSKAGSRVSKGVIRRLHSAGFQRVAAKPKAFGVVAYK